MASNFFQHLAESLSRGADWAAIDRAWHDSEGLLEALKNMLPSTVFTQILHVRRDDPAKGIRGSQLTVITRHASGAAKVRLALADAPAALRSMGWGIQHVRVVERRAQDISAAPAMPSPRRLPVPTAARAALCALAHEIDNPKLKASLARIGQRSSKG